MVGYRQPHQVPSTAVSASDNQIVRPVITEVNNQEERLNAAFLLDLFRLALRPHHHVEVSAIVLLPLTEQV